MSHPLIEQNVHLVRQAIDLLHSLPGEVYAAPPKAGSEAPAIGPHVRHCLDFYLCLLDGLEQRAIDYDSRSRRADVERDRRTAMAELTAVAERIERIDLDSLSAAVELRREAADGAGPADLLASTVGRELQFLASHTVHHYALIALALRLEGHPVPSGFGVAPSTLEHWRRLGRVAS